MAAVTVKSEIWAHLLSFQASFPPFQGLIRYFLLTSMHVSNFEIFCIWPKIGQISFFSTILYYNLTKSPTHFIFGEYAVGGVSNFVSVFDNNCTGRFKVIRTWTFHFLKYHIKRLISTLKLVFILFLWSLILQIMVYMDWCLKK